MIDYNCQGCGKCVEVCYVRVITIHDGKGMIDEESCKGCGRCAAVCPEGAVHLELTDDAFLEKIVRELGTLVDVTKD